MPTLVQAMVQYICILLAALAMRPTLMTALKLALMSIVCKATQRMLSGHLCPINFIQHSAVEGDTLPLTSSHSAPTFRNGLFYYTMT